VSAPTLCFELVVALTALQRLVELVHSRRNLARLASTSANADSGVNWIALVLLQSLWLVGSALEPILRGGVVASRWLWLGGACFVAGQALRTWCILILGRSWNARGRVDPGLTIVSAGPYRWVRHPNYLGVLLEVLGLPLAGGATWTLALAFPLHGLVLMRRMRGEDALLFALPGYAERMGAKGALLPRRERR
jgi:methyltransferase